MSKSKFNGYTASGIGLISLALIPTPDDITIVSPALQLGIGAVLIAIGLKRGE